MKPAGIDVFSFADCELSPRDVEMTPLRDIGEKLYRSALSLTN